jgi:hypothetical protein
MAALKVNEPETDSKLLATVQNIKCAGMLALVVGHQNRGDSELACAALSIRSEFFAPFNDALCQAYVRGAFETLASLSALRAPDKAHER